MIFLTNSTLFGLTITAPLLPMILTCGILTGIVFAKSGGTLDFNKNKSQEQRIDKQSQIIQLNITHIKKQEQKINDNTYSILHKAEENINTIQFRIKNIAYLPDIHNSEENIHCALLGYIKILNDQFSQFQDLYNKLSEQTNTMQQIYDQANNLKDTCSRIISQDALSDLVSFSLPNAPPLDHQERLNYEEEDDDDKPIRIRVAPDQ